MSQEIKPILSKEAEKQWNEFQTSVGKVLTDLTAISTTKLKFDKIDKVSTEKQKQIEINKELNTSLKQLENAEKALIIAQSEAGKKTAVLRLETQEQNKANKEAAKNVLKLTTEFEKLQKEQKKAELIAKEYAATLGVESKEFKEAADKSRLLKQQIVDISKATGDSGPTIGRYGTQWEKVGISMKNAFASVAGALGITFAISKAVEFGKELNTLAIEAKGVEFAFARLGERGVTAFEKVKASTRGTLSNLDIKRALVDFDNFNISLEETDVLFEFLAVRATQTGKSVEELQSSLVEGLSKESKLRIDNLGISTAELNAELEKTPNFVQAVANIAKREVAEAGNILDKAGNSQAQWNAKIENTKLLLADKALPYINQGFKILNKSLDFVVDNFDEIVNGVRIAIKAFSAYKGTILIVNGVMKAHTISTGALSVANAGMTGGFKAARQAVIAFSASLKITPIGLITSSIGLLVAAFVAFKSGASEAAKQQERLNLAMEKGKENADAEAKSIDERIEKEIALIEQKKREVISETKNAKDISDIENKALNDKISVYKKEQDVIAKRIAVLKQSSLQFLQDAPIRKELETQIDAESKKYAELSKEIKSLTIDKKELAKQTEENAAADKAEVLTIIQRLQKLDAEQKQLIANKQVLDELTKSENISTSNRKLANDELDKTSKRLKSVQDEMIALGGALNNLKVPTEEFTDVDLTDIVNIADVIEKATTEVTDIVSHSIDQLGKDFESGAITAEDYLLELENANENTQKRIIDSNINALKQILVSKNLSVEQQKEINDLLNDLYKKASDEEQKTREENAKKTLNREKKTAEELAALAEKQKENAVAIANATLQAITMIGNELFNNNKIRLSNEMNDAQKRYDYEVLLAEQSGESEEVINAKKAQSAQILADKQNEIKRRQAQIEKEQAIFNAAINIALGVTSALSQVPAGFAMAGVVAALGAVEIALIASKKIPKFKTGVENFEGGLATVGDGGREIVVMPSKEMFLAEREMTTYLPKGTTVLNNSKTEKLLNDEKSLNLLKQIRNKKMIFNNVIKIKADRMAHNLRK